MDKLVTVILNNVAEKLWSVADFLRRHRNGN